MRVLMTGAGGFIGKHVINYFSKSMENDHLVLLTSSPINGFDCIHYTNYNVDVSSLQRKGPFDCILLLGAFVEHNGRNEKELTRKHLSSVNSIDNLLRNLPNVPRKVVYCSSIAVYGIDSALPYQSSNGVLFSEDSKVDPVRTYALSKVFGERLVSEWCSEHDVGCQIVRIGTIYDYSGKQNNFMGYLIKAIREQRVFEVSAPLGQLWNFVYVEDLCRWILNAIRIKNVPGVINLTSSENYTTSELLSMAENYDSTFQYTVLQMPHYRGVDKGFVSTKREKYLGEESFPISYSLPFLLKQHVSGNM